MTFARAAPGPRDPSFDMGSVPALLGIAEGTRDLTDDVAVEALLAAVRRASPGLHVISSLVDVQQPDITGVLAHELAVREAVVAVPLMLWAGFHLHDDLSHELDGDHSRRTAMAATLGPDDVIVRLLASRLRQVGLRADDVVVLAAVGSSDHRAVRDCVDAGRRLASLIERTVTVGFVSAAVPRLSVAIDTMRRLHPGSRVVVASYLLSSGRVAEAFADAGGDVVAGPLLVPSRRPPQALVDLVLTRYREGAAQLG